MSVNIQILRIGDDTGVTVQTANSLVQAEKLIKNVMPKLKSGYTYIIK